MERDTKPILRPLHRSGLGADQPAIARLSGMRVDVLSGRRGFSSGFALRERLSAGRLPAFAFDAGPIVFEASAPENGDGCAACGRRAYLRFNVLLI